MEYREQNADLFTMPQEYYLAHCISSDCEMGAGIAVEFQRRFQLRGALLVKYDTGRRKAPTCILEKRVFNLITKERYWQKPTLATLRGALLEMRRLIINNHIKYLAMPAIGCGKDRLKWDDVRELLHSTLCDLDLTVVVCFKD